MFNSAAPAAALASLKTCHAPTLTVARKAYNTTSLAVGGGGGGNPAPTIILVAPILGSTLGGTALTVTGTGFAAGASLKVGGTAAVQVNVASAGVLTALTPAHVAGATDVTVTNPDGQSATLAGGFTFVPPVGETVLLADDFNDNSLDLSKWDATSLFSGYTDTGLPMAETNQRIEIGPLLVNASGSHYRGIRTARAYDFTGAYCYVALTQAPAANTAADAMFTIGQDANSYYRIYVEAGTLICQKRINGAKSNLFVSNYDAVSHWYWRIRHDAAAGAVVFETAPDNSGVPGAWTERYREAWNTAAVPLSSVQLELKAGTWQVEANRGGTVSFDNFKLAKP